jgi:hypothetical protein
MEKMVQPEDTEEKDISIGDDGEVVAASPEPRRRRGKGKFWMGPKPERKEDCDETTDSESDEEDLLICAQCGSVVDPERDCAYNSKWKHSKEEGYGMNFNDKLFCNQPCLSRDLEGLKPTEPTEQIRLYQEEKTRRTCQDLLIFRAYEHFNREGPEEWVGISNQPSPVGAEVAAARVRVTIAALGSQWSNRRGGKATEEASAAGCDIVTLQKNARDFRMKLQREIKDRIRAIDEDDPDKEWKTYRLERNALLTGRRLEDIRKGIIGVPAYERHRMRLRQEMKRAVRLGAVPERIGRDPKPMQPFPSRRKRRLAEKRTGG